MIVDIGGITAFQIINTYRSFNPQNGVSSREAFLNQLKIIHDALTENTESWKLYSGPCKALRH